MKAAAILFLAAATLALGTGVAQARLGDSAAEIVRQLGPPVRHNARVRAHRIIGSPDTTGDVHLKDSWFVRVVYGSGFCVQVEYSPRAGGLSRSQVDAILADESRGSRWSPGAGGDARIQFFRRVDGLALASWTTGEDGSLLIAAEDSGAVWRGLLLEAR